MSKEITKNSELVVGDFYHCFSLSSGIHSINKCYEDGDKFLGLIRVWATDSNDQALKRWKIYTVDVPNTQSIGLCKKHHGIGFISDCAVCKRNKVLGIT